MRWKHAVTENTVIIPVMNGVDPGERIRKALGKGTVVDSLIYIVAFANKDYSVTQQGDFANLRIGIRNADEDSAAKGAGGIRYPYRCRHRSYDRGRYRSRDLAEIYPETARIIQRAPIMTTPSGQLRSDPKKAEEYEALVREGLSGCAGKKAWGSDRSMWMRFCIVFYHELAENADQLASEGYTGREEGRGGKHSAVTSCGKVRGLESGTPVTEKDV